MLYDFCLYFANKKENRKKKHDCIQLLLSILDKTVVCQTACENDDIPMDKNKIVTTRDIQEVTSYYKYHHLSIRNEDQIMVLPKLKEFLDKHENDLIDIYMDSIQNKFQNNVNPSFKIDISTRNYFLLTHLVMRFAHKLQRDVWTSTQKWILSLSFLPYRDILEILMLFEYYLTVYDINERNGKWKSNEINETKNVYDEIDINVNTSNSSDNHDIGYGFEEKLREKMKNICIEEGPSTREKKEIQTIASYISFIKCYVTTRDSKHFDEALHKKVVFLLRLINKIQCKKSIGNAFYQQKNLASWILDILLFLDWDEEYKTLIKLCRPFIPNGNKRIIIRGCWHRFHTRTEDTEFPGYDDEHHWNGSVSRFIFDKFTSLLIHPLDMTVISALPKVKSIKVKAKVFSQIFEIYAQQRKSNLPKLLTFYIREKFPVITLDAPYQLSSINFEDDVNGIIQGWFEISSYVASEEMIELVKELNSRRKSSTYADFLKALFKVHLPPVSGVESEQGQLIHYYISKMCGIEVKIPQSKENYFELKCKGIEFHRTLDKLASFHSTFMMSKSDFRKKLFQFLKLTQQNLMVCYSDLSIKTTT